MGLNRLGIIQGRLSPPVSGEIQKFPGRLWKEEFDIAAKCDFEVLEWVLDDLDLSINPLLSVAGRSEIIEAVSDSGISVSSICCDYFMQNNFSELRNGFEPLGVLTELCRICSEVGIEAVELPLVGKSSLTLAENYRYIQKLLKDMEPYFRAHNVKVLLESDLEPPLLNDFIRQFPNDLIQINYDIGNSAYWAFDAAQEMELYADRIGSVHIKDCTPEDYSVPLGSGNADFELIFKRLAAIGYEGDFILQTARAEDDVGVAVQFADFTRDLMRRYFS